MLSFDQALEQLLATASPLGAERVSVFEADGRVLAEDVRAPFDLPMFDYSAMDGYALAASDLAAGAPLELLVVGESAAGSGFDELVSRTTCRIFTGAPMPRGADTVVMQEEVETFERDGAQLARFREAPPAGKHIRRQGEDLAHGSTAIAAGTRLTPGKVALLAALDRAAVSVTRRPIVAVMGTGDELRSPGDPARPASVVESNGFYVSALARRVGAVARLAPFIPDRLELAAASIARELTGCDVLVTIGGVSVGTRDVVRPALEAAGVTLDFYKVAMKPGKPLTVGRRGATVVLGLPGNPASACLTFALFGVPLLRALSGLSTATTPQRSMRVLGRLTRSPGRTEFARARFVEHQGQQAAELLPNQASGAVTSFASAEALVVIPADHGTLEHGETLDVIDLRSLG